MERQSLQLSTNKFSFNKETKTFVAEVSELGLGHFFSQGVWKSSIILINPKTGGKKFFDWKDFDMNGDEVAGGNYKSSDGLRLLLIND